MAFISLVESLAGDETYFRQFPWNPEPDGVAIDFLQLPIRKLFLCRPLKSHSYLSKEMPIPELLFQESVHDLDRQVIDACLIPHPNGQLSRHVGMLR